MTVLAVRHITTYRYREPVTFGDHRIMFRPRDSYDQLLLGSQLEISPAPSSVRWIHDVFGNCVAIASFATRSDLLRIETNIKLDHTPQNTPDFTMDNQARNYPFLYAADELPDLMRSIERQFADPDRQVDRWARRFLRGDGRSTDTAHMLMTMTYAIKESFTYVRRVESGTQDPITTLRLGRGTCRDFALLMMEAARALGLAARFVTGYLYVPDRDGEGHVGGGSTHAWCQIYLPGAGWVEFDPTNGIIGNRDLIRVAVTRNPRQAVPLSGTYTGYRADQLDMTVEVRVIAPDDPIPLSNQSQTDEHHPKVEAAPPNLLERTA